MNIMTVIRIAAFILNISFHKIFTRSTEMHKTMIECFVKYWSWQKRTIKNTLIYEA